MLKTKKILCVAVLAVGLSGAWYASMEALGILRDLRAEVRGPATWKKLLDVPKEKLEGTSAESLVLILKGEAMVQRKQHRFYQAVYEDLLVTSFLLLASNLIVTTTALGWVVSMWRRERPKGGAEE